MTKKSRVWKVLLLSCSVVLLLEQSAAETFQSVNFGSATVNVGPSASQAIAFSFTGLNQQPTAAVSYGIDFQRQRSRLQRWMD